LIGLSSLFCTLPAIADFISADPPEAIVRDPRRALDEDACPPQTIVSVPLTLTGNTSTSANDYGANCGAAGSSPDDIYALSLRCRGLVTVSLCGSGYDCVIEVHTGTNYFDCPGAYIDCNDDFCDLQSQLSFFVEIDAYYFIIVTGFNGASGPYTLNVTQVSQPPPNDNCSSARVISNAPYQDFGSTTCANNSFTPPCAFSNAPDVLYRLNMPCDAFVEVTTCGHPLMDAVLEVKKYGACPGTNPVGCNDDACEFNQSYVAFPYEAFQDYYILVDGYSTNSGYYVLHVNATGDAADQCGSIIIALPVTLTGNTVCEHDDYPQCNFGTSNDDIHVLQPLAECRIVTATLCGTSPDFDTVLEIRKGGSFCPGSTLVSCTDDGYCGDNFTLQSTATFIAEPGETYYFMVNGYFGSVGDYVLTITDAPCELAAPESLVVRYNVSTNAYDLNWAAVAGATEYNVFRSVGLPNPGPPDIGDYIGTTAATNFSDDAGLPFSPTGYFYQVTAVANYPSLLEPRTPPSEREILALKGQAVRQEPNSQPRMDLTRPEFLDQYSYTNPQAKAWEAR
jgi:hypothetical protein